MPHSQAEAVLVVIPGRGVEGAVPNLIRGGYQAHHAFVIQSVGAAQANLRHLHTVVQPHRRCHLTRRHPAARFHFLRLATSNLGGSLRSSLMMYE